WLCRPTNGRLHGIASLPTRDPDAVAREIRRIAGLGMKGALCGFRNSVSATSGSTVSLFDRQWDPVWVAAEETGVALSFHLGGGLHTLRYNVGSWEMAAASSCSPMQLDELLAGVIFSGILDRHPRLQIVIAESGIGWVPYLLNRMELIWDKY